jgi:hypothetical protein
METATRKSKKVDKRETFAEVFERQARRFSAFDLLGIEPAPLSPSPSSPRNLNSSEGESNHLVREIEVKNIEPDSTEQRTTTPPSQVHRTDGIVQAHRTDSGSSFETSNTKFDKAEQSTSQLDTQRLAGRDQKKVGPSTETDRKNTGRINTQYSFVDDIATSKSEEYSPDGQTFTKRIDNPTQEHRTDGPSQEYRTDGMESLGSDPSEGLTVRPKNIGRTVRPDLGRTPYDLGRTPGIEVLASLGTDGPSVELGPDHDATLLAPLQWKVWQLLQTVTDGQATISYRKIAKQIKSTIEGVRKAIRIIQKEGGFLTKEVVRTADEQGVRLTINPHVRFRSGTLNEAKGILKRGLHLGRTSPGPTQVHGPDGPGMYVCTNLNIGQTDVVKLLRIPPLDWKIREQTLIQIADALPDMTALEFRLSLAYLVEQAKTGKEPVRHPNAWIKATFEKNGGPLVTEREIETRFSHPTVKSEVNQPHNLEQEMSQELDLMRRYLACAPEDRSAIDDLAQRMAAPLLKIVSDDKKSGIMGEARISALKEFFSARGKV